MNVNKFIGCGHLGKDPEVRTTQSGTTVANFSVGITSSEKVNGEWTKTTEWVNCVAFGKQAEWLGEASKGDLCHFDGRMKSRKWQDKEGKDRYTTEIICDNVQTQKKSTGYNSAEKNQSTGYDQSPLTPSDDYGDAPF